MISICKKKVIDIKYKLVTENFRTNLGLSVPSRCKYTTSKLSTDPTTFKHPPLRIPNPIIKPDLYRSYKIASTLSVRRGSPSGMKVMHRTFGNFSDNIYRVGSSGLLLVLISGTDFDNANFRERRAFSKLKSSYIALDEFAETTFSFSGHFRNKANHFTNIFAVVVDKATVRFFDDLCQTAPFRMNDWYALTKKFNRTGR